MASRVEWTQGEEMLGITSDGKRVMMHTDDTASPMQLLILSHGACSMIDVVVGLKDRMENVRAAWVEVDVDRAENVPRKLTAVRMHYVIEGNVPEKLVERLIHQSHEKYCSVGATILGGETTLDWTMEIRSQSETE
ncbi:MAG: OsmC family protein [Candidatus Thalassarchaeaceae archaeon]